MSMTQVYSHGMSFLHKVLLGFIDAICFRSFHEQSQSASGRPYSRTEQKAENTIM